MSYRQLILLFLIFTLFYKSVSKTDFDEQIDEFSIWHDYSPPSPPPPLPYNPPSCSCEDDLGGVGSFDTLCLLKSSVQFTNDVYIKGNGSLNLLPGVELSCRVRGCMILVNLSGAISLESGSGVVAGSVKIAALNMNVGEGAAVVSSALAGDPPPKTSGAATGIHGDGGGYGGRGASCFVREGQSEDDSWGGDAYAWATLTMPDSYGSKGGSTSLEEDFGGIGGGRIWLEIEEVVDVNGTICADGGDGGPKGGGGSGGSIYISASKM